MYVDVQRVFPAAGPVPRRRGPRRPFYRTALVGLGSFGLGAAQATTPAQLSIAQMVVDTANDWDVPPQLALAIASHESGFNPNAVNPNGGAAGVMQLLPSTAAGLAVSNPLDPQENIDGGVQLLAQLLQQYNGNETLALWAYSNGAGSVTAGGSNPANMPAQAAGLVAYANSYQVPAGLDLSGTLAADTTSSEATDTSDDSSDPFGDLTSGVSDLVSSASSFLVSADPTTLAVGGLALLGLAWAVAR